MSIRLIAADMDGTLLDSRKQLPEGLFPLVARCMSAACASPGLGPPVLHTLRAVR